MNCGAGRFFVSSRRRHTRFDCDWSSDVCSSDLFHLAAIVSGQAEADTDLGYRINLDGTRAVLDACRALGTAPRVIFASSLAVYGGAVPPPGGGDTAFTPPRFYGSPKGIGALLVNDYRPQGFVRCR